jgi:serine/threonine protein phosphatase 1
MRWFSTQGVDSARQGTLDPGGNLKPKDRWLSGFSWLLPDAGQRVSYPAAPDDTTIYVVGDIHGRIDLVEEVCARIDRDISKEAPRKVIEVYLGDYVDRGPAPAKVIDFLVRRRAGHDDREIVFLRGNHEHVLQIFLAGEATFDDWRQMGGLETLISYGMESDLLHNPIDDEVRQSLIARMPKSHMDFLRDLRLNFRCGKYFFVHAGIRPGIALDAQNEHDCLWIRDEFLEHDDDFGCIVVHGHSPVSAPELMTNRINLDTAAYATGHLSCLKISDKGARLLESAG